MSQRNMRFDTSDVILYVVAFFLPPFPILIRVGFWSSQFLLNVLLTFLFGVPGTLHALYWIYITSPITGSPERRVGGHYDYERVDDHENVAAPQNQEPLSSDNNNDPTVGSSYAKDDSGVAPPPYDASLSPNPHPTDNKVQQHHQ